MIRILIIALLFARSIIAQATNKPNFIVILTVDQSWVGSSLQIIPDDPRTRSDYFKTPHIERMAAMGMRFTQGYSPAASCCPTRRSIQTGQTPARHEYQKDRGNWTTTYNAQLNIPRMLKAANPAYQTAHFGKWDHRYDQISPYEQGYDFSDGYTGNFTGGAKNTGGPMATKDPKRINTITDQALHFMERNHARNLPFYLQVSHYAVHLDIFYNQTTLNEMRAAERGRKHNMPEFAAMTRDMDSGIGRILDKLIELDLLESTYLIYLSDNGGRNTVPKAPDMIEQRNAPLRNGKHSFYEGGIRVPFIALGPAIEPGSVSHVPVSGVDLLPTFADLAGYPHKLPSNIDGGSLDSVFANGETGKVVRPNPFLVFHQAVDRSAASAIRLGDYKLVKTWKSDKLELFDLSKDISEANDLSRRMSSKTQELHRKLTDYLAEVGAETRRTED